MTALESGFAEIVREAVRDVMREERRRGSSGDREEAEYITPKAAAKVVGVSVSTIRDWEKAGLKTYGTGRIKRVKLTELRAYFEHLAEAAAPKTEPEEVAARILATIGAKGRLR